ncbi:MAG: metallo-mystery pair system four-Cys motif protein [Candidatus Binatia bacterium]
MRTRYRFPLACGLLAVLCAAPAARAHTDAPGLDVNGQCVGDADGDAAVAINELILAVNNALTGCAERPVEIQFRGMVGDQDFACGTAYSGIGTGDSLFLPSDFRFYVSDIRLVTPAGEEVPVTLEQDGVWQYRNVAMIDFENGSGPCQAFGNEATHSTVRGTVRAGVYTGVTFALGLPFDLNHGNAATAPAPLNFTAMFWNWQLGYKFIRVDTADDKLRIHLGSTGCESGGPSRPPTSCSAPNIPAVALSGFDPDRGVIVADLKALLSQNDIDANAPDTEPGCMSSPLDPDCGPLFNSLGLGFPGGAPIAGQRFFRVGEAASNDHKEIAVASAQENGGALVAHPEFDTAMAIPAFLADCLGGTGEECDGGTRVFTTVNPGIEPLAASEPDESLFTLAGGTPVSLQVTAIDAGLTLRLGGTTLDGAGDSVLLGTAPDFHADFEAQLALPGGGAPSGRYSVTFRLTTTASGYEGSSDVTVTFTPTEGSGHH